jgi:hypothetical protein
LLIHFVEFLMIPLFPCWTFRLAKQVVTSKMSFSRQSVHLVLNEGRGLYSLRNMDVSKLFYPSTAQALEAEAKAAKKKQQQQKDGIFKLGSIGRLPGPSINYLPFSPPGPNSLVDVFARFGENKNKILYSNAEGHTNIYNTELHSFMAMPALNLPKGRNFMAAHVTRTAAHARSDFDISPEVDYGIFAGEPRGDHTDSLYMMDMSFFEVLAYYPSGEWQWRPLPLPPFCSGDDPERKACSNKKIPHAVVDGTRICVSSATATYSFDTVAIKWSKAGDWVLPFHTKADFVSELNRWIGLSASSPSDLCAVDLSAGDIDSRDVPPLVQHVGLDVDLPKDWSLKSRTLVNLGAGRFCIAMFFNTADAQGSSPQVVVFTGVGVVPTGDNHQGPHTLRGIKHKSKCFPTDRIEYVL